MSDFIKNCFSEDCLLVIVDMQNDFVTGSLANEDAQKIIPIIKQKAEAFNGDVVYTRDTHYEDYLDTQEGFFLPVKHCCYNSWGWEIVDELKHLDIRNGKVFDKFTFSSIELARWIRDKGYKRVHLCGTCTDICVISCAMAIKAICPEILIGVFEDACAGSTPESHQKALDIMRCCQIVMVDSWTRDLPYSELIPLEKPKTYDLMTKTCDNCIYNEIENDRCRECLYKSEFVRKK